MAMLRLLRSIVVTAFLLVVGAVVLSVVLSPPTAPTAGRQRAADLGIPYRALIAHRGASQIAPEGTAPAYILAREMGADYLEADLQRTTDGVIVVFHDDTLERTTNVFRIFPDRRHDPIETFTYDELMQLDAGSWFNEQYPERARPSFVGERILTLEQLLDIAAAGKGKPIRLYLETKGSDRHSGYETEIVNILRQKGWLPPPGEQMPEARIVFQSFNPDSLRALQRLAPEVPRVLLISAEMEAEHGWRHWLDVAEEVADGIGPIGYLAWPWHTGAAHRRNLLVHPYVINEAWQMYLLTLFGADGIFTDDLKLALRVFGRPKPLDPDGLLRENGY